MSLTIAGRIIFANSVDYTSAALHSANPGDLGDQNELNGGELGFEYERQVISFADAQPVDDGNGNIIVVRNPENDPVFNVPAGSTVSHISLWSGDVCVDVAPLSNIEDYTGAGIYTAKPNPIVTT